MAYQTLTEFNATGMDGMLVYVSTVVPIFIPLVLFSFFTIITLATYFSQRRLTGRGNFFSSLSVAGFSTTILAFIMTLIPDLINTLTLVVTVSITIVAVIILLLTKGD